MNQPPLNVANTPFTIRVPATSANLGPGFDTFGMALALYNQFTFQLAPQDTLTLAPTSPLTPDLSALGSASNSLLFKAIDAVFQLAQTQRPPLACQLHITIPFHGGLGSSATAIVAGALAANRLLGNPFTQQHLLNLVTAMEGHPDNVAPALLGGVGFYTVSATPSTEPYPHVTAYPLPWPNHWQTIALLSPNTSTSTHTARALLPQTYPLADCITTLRQASLLTYALLQSNEAALKAALYDVLHEPYRGQALPDLEPIRQAWVEAGGFGIVISGSGPTLLGLCHTNHTQTLLQLINTHFPHRQAVPLTVCSSTRT